LRRRRAGEPASVDQAHAATTPPATAFSITPLAGFAFALRGKKASTVAGSAAAVPGKQRHAMRSGERAGAEPYRPNKASCAGVGR